MRTNAFLSLGLLGFVSGCAPALVNGTMRNPASTTDKLQSTQEYDVGPDRESHRYRITLGDWTPQSIGARIQVADPGPCGHTTSYAFTLVDEQGGRHPFRPDGAETPSTETIGGAAVKVATVAGKFDVAIGAKTPAVTIQMRPVESMKWCPALDFRWGFTQ